MSDSIRELCKKYEENVVESQGRSVGLFTIPEYPEFEEGRGMWSTAFNAILTTLRYLAPATLLTLLWGQQSFIFKLLNYIDSAIRALLFSSEEQKQAVLQWLSEYGPVRVDDLGTVWRQGWILCGVLDAALPGACAGHPPTSLTLKHAQAISDHYLGVEPVFSRQELESNGTLSKHQEWKLITFIDCIRHALTRINPSITKPSLQKKSSETTQFTLDYVARGSGLIAAQIKNRMFFKIYPTSQQSPDPGDIRVQIKGPDETYGLKILPPILGKAQLIRQQLLGIQSQKKVTDKVIPFTHGATYLRSYGKNDMSKTYHIPKTKYDIEIETESAQDHVKVGYTVNLDGKYEISITSKGQNIVGSPYTINTSRNIIGLLENESFSLEDGEEIDIVNVKSDKKVVLRIVDFVSEKMLLKENGVLERISEEEAKYLMEVDVKVENLQKIDTVNFVAAHSVETNKIYTGNRFNEIANKVLKLNKVCNFFKDLKNKKGVHVKDDELEKDINRQSINRKDIPDIVNSTLTETNVNPFTLSQNCDKVIVPENISVSILTEKTGLGKDDCNYNTNDSNNAIEQIHINLTDGKMLNEIDSITSFKNSLVNEMFKENKAETSFDKLVSSKYETDLLKLGRPKSPIFKITEGDDSCPDELICKDHNGYDIKKSFHVEFENQFFGQKLSNESENQNLPIVDFIIGAPVSLPPVIRSLSQETESFDIANKEAKSNILPKNKEDEQTVGHYSSLQASISKTNNENTIEAISLGSVSNITENYNEGNDSPKKEMWDSAYVSIDENNTSPDSNNNNDTNESKEVINKQKYLNTHCLSPNIGPAERELWQNCEEIKENRVRKSHEEITKLNKWELNKSTFTPIIEESTTNASLGMKGIKSESDKNIETDLVTSAIAEINDIYGDYLQPLETSSIIKMNTLHKGSEVSGIIEDEDKYVKSASEDKSDVMRHKLPLEGQISEIQAHATESVSVSQTLHVNENDAINKRNLQNKDKVKCDDSNYTNIVLEKKKYWDERIRQIEAKAAEESRTQQKKRRLSAKQLRHNDSLSKRKGKQILKKYINANDNIQKQTKISEIPQDVALNQDQKILAVDEEDVVEKKRVKNWKDYWDSKLESENYENHINSSKTTAKINTFTTKTVSNDEIPLASVIQVNNMQPSSVPVKQEIPEEVFKAFETSPKRFFGTSRKQILSKIDTFLGKPNAVDEALIDNNIANYESGLVSSRISLFHNISQTEESSWDQRKSQSMHNLYQQRDGESEINNVPGNKKSPCNLIIRDKENSSLMQKEMHRENKTEPGNKITLKEKRARMTDKFYTQSFDETNYHKSIEDNFPHKDSYVKRTITLINKQQPHQACNNSENIRKISSSKSEMDIFNKFTDNSHEEDFSKHKSCDDLPKVSVKNFISLYEDVSKSSTTNSMRKCYNRSPEESEKHFKSASSISGTASTDKSIETSFKIKQKTVTQTNTDSDSSNRDSEVGKKKLQETIRKATNESVGNQKNYKSVSRDFEKESSYISLSDIDLEIVEQGSEKQTETSPDKDVEIAPSDYKSRFKLAKQYFQSLEELREIKKPNKLNECELLLYNKSTESLVDNKNKETKRLKKKTKSHTMPSSEISELWNQLREQQNENNDSKFIKISEKFQVDDLFNDVMEGRFSRQGSFRGIPHKKAVLAAFRSMENISDNRLSPYELAVSQLSDFAKENKIKNAQTYLNEYPYLPTTDPSKYHSRLDANASGLISLKELLNSKVRRNSVPDLRLNASFTVDL